ncbi:serine/threonine-protein kinase [Marilutibacter alkalisoli]|uniref:Protein kinase n=1 Tax=Marilutibacter alkalisoli TaxID=2591633 RepID=A0A514BUX4_9GAMM|nr:serine/threonine-protein kinase [Lysobacter alkalisoli]QDH71167.1 protein kinase [Lysobacter alkalisoli]
MNPDLARRWAEVDAVLDELLEQPEARRRDWLQARCADIELRALVLSLLDADSSHGAALEARAAAVHDWLGAQADALPDVPGYRVLRLIGEGGMASVFLAERMLGETVQQVALKRLRLNVYDPRERRRFEHEHRILARLEHPHIARLIDAGIAPDGVPWFAMEYVEGEPLIAWCNARRLGIDARLDLFADICAAAHYAHQHLVVHRDLKPSNLLVDGEGQVRLLDFGIARLLEPDTGDPQRTGTGLRRLTPGYAAPEQYTGQASTATDVYALGVVLVELLSGQRPLPGTAPGADPMRDLTITRDDADTRATTPRALTRLLSGDLGTIARKAMRSEPALRYGSAQALGDDIAALRAGRPVAARRGDWRYRAACFVRRNKAAVAASALITVTLVAATGISLDQARRARAEAARAQAVQAFVENMLAPLRSGVPATSLPKLDEVLARGVRDLENRRQHDPEVYGELLVMFARTYERMGESRIAGDLAQRAYEHAEQVFGHDDPLTARALALRGRARLGQEDLAEARADLEAARRLMRRHGIEGVALAEVLDDLGLLQVHARRPAEAIPLFTEAQRQRESELGPQHPDLSIGYSNLALAEHERSNTEKALTLSEQAYRHRVQHEGADTREAAILLGNVAKIKGSLGRLHDSAEDHMASLAVFDRLGLRDPPDRFNLALAACSDWWKLDDLERALPQCEMAIGIAEQHWGADSRQHTAARRYRMAMLTSLGRLREAHTEAAGIRAALQAMAGEGADLGLLILTAWSSKQQEVEGDHVGMRDSLIHVFRELGDTHWSLPVIRARLALACTHAPAPDCPSGLIEHADREASDPGWRRHPMWIEGQLTLTRVMLVQGDIAQAHARLDDVESIANQPHVRLPPGHRWLAQARMLRGDAFAAQGDHAAAEREWQAAESVFAARYAADHPFRRGLAHRLQQPEAAR